MALPGLCGHRLMANYLAIAAVAKTLMRLIEEQCPRDEFTSTPSFQLYQTHDFGTNLVTEGFSLMLWRVTVNSMRNQAPRRGRDGMLRRPALPLDLHFILTPWAGHAQLAAVLRSLDHGRLS